MDEKGLVLVCPKFDCEDHRGHNENCFRCEAGTGVLPPCSISNICHHCTKEFSQNCPMKEKKDEHNEK